MAPLNRRSPRIVVTLGLVGSSEAPGIAARKNALYVDALLRHGATVVALDAGTSPADRAAALVSMEGLLLSGGADVDPGRYAALPAGAVGIEAARDALETEAFAAAGRRGLPVLGICRGLQAMNVFSGGSLIQHVDGHAGAGWLTGPALSHPLRLVPGSKLARILGPTPGSGGVLTVNSFHHQGVRARDLAPAFVASGWASSPAGDLVEALEAPSGPFRMAVQCHPERTESTPRVFERLFAFFVDACRGPLASR